MTVLIIIAVIILIVLLIPVGVDFAFTDGRVSLDVKISFWRRRLLHAMEDKPKKEKKPKKGKKKKAKETPPENAENAGKKGRRKKQKLKLVFTFDDIIEIAKVAFCALGRFGRSISVDRFELRIISAASDPYDTAMQYGYINAALGTLMPLVRKAIKIRYESIETSLNFETTKPEIDARVVATVQIWEILNIVFCAAFAALAWFIRIRRASKKAAKAAAGKGN